MRQQVTDNVITLIGLALSIDYALFVVARFRDELAAGHDTRRASATTMSTAGRTVALALASLLFFPQGFLGSMAYGGGMVAAAIAVIASLTVVPAWLAVLGPKIHALRVPRLGRRRHRSADGRPIHPDTIPEWFARPSWQAGLPPIRLHDIRH